jgi:hypothetical protein
MTELDHRLGSGGPRTTSGTSWPKPLGKAEAGEPPARRLPPRRRGRLAPEGLRTTSGTSWPSRKRVASRK